MKPLQEEGGSLSPQMEPPEEREISEGGAGNNAVKDTEECPQKEKLLGQGVKLSLVKDPHNKELQEAAMGDASQVQGGKLTEKETQKGGVDASTLEDPTEPKEGQAGDELEPSDVGASEGFNEKKDCDTQEGGRGASAKEGEQKGSKEEQKGQAESVEEKEREEGTLVEKGPEKDFERQQDLTEGVSKAGDFLETDADSEDGIESGTRSNSVKQEAYTERYEARASMEIAAGRGGGWIEERENETAGTSKDAELSEIPNPPGSVGYFSQSSPLKQAKASLFRESLQLTDVLGNLRSRESSPGGQPDAASWQHQVDRLSEPKRGEAFKQDLNVEWVASVAEADQAQNAVTKNLEAQLVLLQKVAATRYGEENAEAEEPEKESHAETMRKLKAELAALEEKAAAQKLMKRQPGFAELRTASEKPEKPAKKARERYWKLSDEEIREGLEAKRKRRPNGLYMCQVEGCEVNLENAKAYNKRHHVCWEHSRAWEVNINGLVSRFCQQCSRFHDVREFDEIKRSCRERLLHHNKRRRTIADPNRKSPSEPEGEFIEVFSKDDTPQPRKKRVVRRGSSSTPAEPEADPVQKALYTLMRAREQLGGAENPLANAPPERLPHFGGEFRAPGAYGLEPNPISETGVSRLASLRHDSTELTLARRGSGLSGFAEIAVQPNLGRLGQTLPTNQPSFPQSGGGFLSQNVGLEPNQDPSFEALVQSRLQQFLETSSQQNPQQLRSPEANLTFPDRTKQFASEVASRSPLLAAYVQGLDSFTSRGGQNGSAAAPPGLATPLSDFLRGGENRQELFEPRRDESYLDPNQLGAIYRSEEPVRENRLLRLMSESAAPLNWGRHETPSDPLSALQQFAGQDVLKGGGR